MLSTTLALKISHMPYTTLARYKAKGLVPPAFVGRPGRGRPDLYTYAQVFGLIVVHALREHVGCSLDGARRIMTECGAVSNEEFARVVGPEPDPDDGYVDVEAGIIPMPDYHREESAAMFRYLWPTKEVAEAVRDRASVLFDYFRGRQRAATCRAKESSNPRCRTSPRSTSKAK
jgi:hypothetical protein